MQFAVPFRRLFKVMAALAGILVFAYAVLWVINVASGESEVDVVQSRQAGSGDIRIDGIGPDPAGLPGSSSVSDRLGLSNLFRDAEEDTNKLHYSSSVTMEADAPSVTLNDAVRMVTAEGGSVVSLNVESGDDESAIGQFRVPTEKFLAVVDGVSGLGTNVHKSVSASDATQYSYYGQPTTGQVNTATFHVTISAPGMGVRDRSIVGSFTHAAATGWDATGLAVRFVLVAAGTLLPLSIVVIPALLVAAITVRLAGRGWRALVRILHV
jgi:hypothetical protein